MNAMRLTDEDVRLRDHTIGRALVEADNHRPWQGAVCNCGFGVWSVEHVLIMSMRAALDVQEAQRDDWITRWEARRIIDSYTLTMVDPGGEEYVDACADDVIHRLLGWPVTYETRPAHQCDGEVMWCDDCEARERTGAASQPAADDDALCPHGFFAEACGDCPDQP